jgi:glutathione S-transferase
LHEALKSNTLPKFLSKFNELKGQNQGGFLIGRKLTWADIFIADKIDRLTQAEGLDVLDKYPHLLKFRDNVLSHPNLKSYVDQRPSSSQ